MILRGRIRTAAVAATSLALAAVAAGCASPQIDHPFDGLQSLAPASGASEDNDPPRLFIIHGMTTTPDSYADSLVGGPEPVALRAPHEVFRDQPYAVAGAVSFDGADVDINLRTYHLYDGPQETLRVSALTWSPLTASIKQHQFRRDNELSRALINGEIKTSVLNDGLSDATLYLGTYQTVMRRGVMIGLCAFLEGEFANDQCNPTSTSHANVALISESLGSYMLFDAIEALNRTNANSPAGEPLFRAASAILYVRQSNPAPANSPS